MRVHKYLASDNPQFAGLQHSEFVENKLVKRVNSQVRGLSGLDL